MFFSASSLVKHSAKSICYFRNKLKQKSNNLNNIYGNKLAEEKTKGLREMRGMYKFEGNILFYCFDDVRISDKIRLYEHKSVQFGEIQDWYLKSSIVQVAFYHSLALLNPNKNYVTASFVQGPTEQFTIDRKIKSILWIGNDKYIVRPTNTKEIVKFHLNKARATLSYDDAQAWDSQWKHKEADYLMEYIKIKKL